MQVFQSAALFDSLTVRENVGFMLYVSCPKSLYCLVHFLSCCGIWLCLIEVYESNSYTLELEVTTNNNCKLHS